MKRRYMFKKVMMLITFILGSSSTLHTDTEMPNDYSPFKEEVIGELFKNGIIKFGDFTLKSGKKSSYYVDLREIISYPILFKKITYLLAQESNMDTADVICGVPYAALPYASAIAFITEKPMIMRRKEEKKYGTQKIIEGIARPHDRCLLIEDVVTTGASVLETIQILENIGLLINEIIILVDRQQGGIEQLQKKGYCAKALFTITQITTTLYKHGLLEENKYKAIISS